MRAVAIVPAAGSAERFGGAKLLADVGGQPLLERTVRSLREGGASRVIVVLAPGADEIRSSVPALGESWVSVVTNRRPERGMISSIQAGLREAEASVLLVLPGDMPYVEPATVAGLLRKHEETGGIVSPRFDGKRGHPVVMPGALKEEILAVAEDATLHDVLRAHASERVDVDVYDRGVIRDVDEKSDLEERAP